MTSTPDKSKTEGDDTGLWCQTVTAVGIQWCPAGKTMARDKSGRADFAQPWPNKPLKKGITMPILTTAETEAQVLKTLRETAATTFLSRHALDVQNGTTFHHKAGTWFSPRYTVNLEALLLGENWGSLNEKKIPGGTSEERQAAVNAFHAECVGTLQAAVAAVKALVPPRFLAHGAARLFEAEYLRIRERLTPSFDCVAWRVSTRCNIEASAVFANLEGFEGWLMAGIDALAPKRPKAFSPSFRSTLDPSLDYSDDAGVIATDSVRRLGYSDLMWLAKHVHTGSSEVEVIKDGRGYRMANGVDSSEREKICGIECARAWRDWTNKHTSLSFMRYVILDWEDFMDHVTEGAQDLPTVSWEHCLDLGANSPADWVVSTAMRQVRTLASAEAYKAKNPDWASDDDTNCRLSHIEDTDSYKMKPLGDVEYMLWSAKRFMESSMARYSKVYDTLRATAAAHPGLMAALQSGTAMAVFEVFVEHVLADSDKLSTLLTLSSGAKPQYSHQLWYDVYEAAWAISSYVQHKSNTSFLKSFRSEIKRLAKS